MNRKIFCAILAVCLPLVGFLSLRKPALAFAAMSHPSASAATVPANRALADALRIPAFFQGVGSPACTVPANAIVAENCQPGNPESEWQVSGSGSTNIQGFATDISVNRGSTISFKVKTNATAYHIDIYRLGYYGGLGARKIATVRPSVALPQTQPTCLSDSTTGLIDCGNWAVSASWTVPSTVVSGIYLGRLVRDDGTTGASHIAFIVRDDASHSDLLFQASDTTWQAYNNYLGQSLYMGSPVGRAYKVSYNRPFVTPNAEEESWIFDAEYPAIRWLEENGYNVSYISGLDTDRIGGTVLKQHKVFLSVGHDEYWSGGQRANVESALAAGVHLAFLSGNEMSWKTRWENSIDGSNTPYRTLVCYKETQSDAKIDPLPNVWTGTWRDPRWSPPADGGRPENGLSGTISTVNAFRTDSIVVPADDGKMRFWRNTSVASQLPGDVTTFAPGTLGYEWDEDLDNGARPAGLFHLSSNTVTNVSYAQDYAGYYTNGGGTATHHLTTYKGASGALVFSAGTVQWAWGLDADHFNAGPAADSRIQQATVNLFADMGVQPATLQSGLVTAQATSDTTPPTATITYPARNSTRPGATPIGITGSATDAGGGNVAAVEVSTDGGTTWHPAIGRETWTYIFKAPTTGVKYTVVSRAVDDSGNLGLASSSVTFTASTASDTTAPTVTAVNPAASATYIDPTTTVSATFSEPIDPATLNATTVVLKNSANAVVPGGITYDSVNRIVTFTSRSGLAYNTSYTMTLVGGSAGIKDAAGKALAANYTWSFTTMTTPAPADDGPGGPILVISSTQNPFSRYYGEILRAEGLNEFIVSDISRVDAARLSTFDTVILGDFPLSSANVSMLTSYVNNGGNLIAMHPDSKLASFLGLTAVGTTLSEGYVLVNTSSGPGVGITGQTIQFHGSADRYTLNGAAAIATLYSTATTATSNPAVTTRSVGSGDAVAFTYDLARSVVYTRQGNPAWSGQNRDGLPPIRSTDLYYGNASFDPQPNYIDFSKIQIPQADEQQRLLANIIRSITAKPLPSFWYFPNMKKAAVIMTGDDHDSGGTAGRFDHYIAQSPANCSVANWECVRSTSYIYVSATTTNTQAAYYNSLGFEVALHVLTNCADWTPTTLDGFYSTQLANFTKTYTSIPSPSTNRTHCIVESDYDTQPQVELKYGIRLDTNYYFYPNTWVQNRPGMFTGSGIPMRFADRGGNTIDVYQATTQMTDESDQDYPLTINTLLDNATGSLGYYGAFTANMHTDNVASPGSDAIVASAQQRGIPIVSSLQMLKWLDGRNASNFNSFTWDGTNLVFNIAVGSNTTGIYALLPANAASGPLTGLQRNNVSISYTTQIIKGVNYAVFPAVAGTYHASYKVDTVAPTIVSRTPAANATGIAVDSTVNVQFSENMAASSLTSSNFRLRAAGATSDVPATVTLNGAIATLTPNQALNLNTSYTATVSGNVTDLAGNKLGSDSSWTFSTVSGGMFLDTTVANFTGGTLDANATILQEGDGEVALTPTLLTYFPGTTLAADWSSTAWNTGGIATVNNGMLSVDGARVGPTATYSAGRSLEFLASFSGAPYQHAGFGVDYNGAPWAMFSSGGGGALYARTNGGGGSDVQIAGSWFNAPHRFRIDWGTSSITYYIDGTQVATQNVAISTPMRPLFSDYSVGSGALTVNWVRMGAYPSSGTFLSRVYDAGGPVSWNSVSWTADQPSGTSLAIAVRGGNTPVPDNTWTAYSAVSNGGTYAISSRYLQYRTQLGTSSMLTPILKDINFGGANNMPTVSIADATLTESNSGPSTMKFTVTISAASAFSSTVNYATADGTAKAGTDYTAASGTLTFPAGTTSQTLNVTVGNNLTQSAYFYVNLANPTNLLLGRAQATGTLLPPPDITPPTIVSRSPAPGAAGVLTTAPVVVQFSEPMNAATISSTTFRLRAAGASSDVPAVVAYSGTTATLTPNAPLTLSQTYTATVAGTVTDVAGNALGSNVSWNFSVQSGTKFTDTTVADFTAGSLDANGYIGQTADGEVMLLPVIGAEFSGTSIPSGWTSTPWTTGTTLVSNGQVTVDGTKLYTNVLYAPGASLEFSANFSGDGFQHVGLGNDFNGAPWAIFSTYGGGGIYVRVNNGSNSIDTPIVGNFLNAFHRYRIDWTATGFVFYIDGAQVATSGIVVTDNMRPLISDYNAGGGSVAVDWLRMSPYASSSTFNSRVFDAGTSVSWTSLVWTSALPAGTAMSVNARSGNTPTPDVTWTNFAPVAVSGNSLNLTGRYFQYQVISATSDPNVSPALQSVTVNYQP